MRAEAEIDACDTRLVFGDDKKKPCFMHSFCIVLECDATHAGHASDPLPARADTIQGARPPKNNFQRHRRLRVAQADLRKTAQTIQQHRPACAHAMERKIRIVAGVEFAMRVPPPGTIDRVGRLRSATSIRECGNDSGRKNGRSR